MTALIPLAAALFFQLDRTEVGTELPGRPPSNVPPTSPASGHHATPHPSAAENTSSPPYEVELNVMIAGLGKDGCELDVRPGHRGCRFQPQTCRVGPQGRTALRFRDVELRGADRTCAFAITIREPGQEEKTFYRGFRLTPRIDSKNVEHNVQSLTCFLTSPSRLASLGATGSTRR
jgi:hypothetical protein